MTKYFYRDPLEAAWMAKHFGMRFISEQIEGAEIRTCGTMYHFGEVLDFVEGRKDAVLDDYHDAICLTCHEEDDRYYVHPESYGMLEAQPGDLVYNVVNKRVWFCQCGDFIRDPNPNVITITEDPEAIWIIQREGKNFFCPERE